jgi:hypothetical protein
MFYWNHTRDQSGSCMRSCQNRVKASGPREVPQSVRDYIIRRILQDEACVALMQMLHTKPRLGMVTGGNHVCNRSRQDRS